ncbi:MAG TPA: arginine--tRNA ligase [Patescibacteria group bacterium]
MNLKDQIVSSLEKASKVKNPNLEFASHEEFGDYTTNVALRNATSAKDLVAKLQKDKDLTKIVEKIEVAGPGFINFHLKKEALLTELAKVLKEKEDYGRSYEGKGKVVVIDYSAPNIAKRFSIGHLRSTIIGQALYNLHKFTGYKVIGDNHLGDWGTQFGVLIYMVEKNKVDPTKLTVEEWEKLYVDFHTKLDSDPSLKEEARHAFKRLEEADPAAKAIWQAAYDTSLKEYQRLYDLLKVKIDYAYGESFYEPMLDTIIKEVQSKKIAKESQGAQIIEFKDLPPAMLVKSDGATTYLTRDLAAIKYRIKTWNPDLFIYEVGADQILHFKQVFATSRLLGWIKDQKMVHVAHGLVRFKEGKMSTRRGKTVKLEEVLKEAVEKAKEFNSDPKISELVGIGAIKYFDLIHEPQSEIIFDWSKIFVLEGKSGPYLQYTYARTQSVLSKAKANNLKKETPSLNQEELSTLRLLTRFPEVISISTKTYSPNILAEYLFTLAQKYNAFYNKHKIIEGDNQDFRLALTIGVGHVLKNGLNLLGIQAPQKM